MPITEDSVRDVTAAEVEFYQQNGWVKLDRLIAPDVAAELLSTTKRRLAAGGLPANRLGQWNEWRHPFIEERAEPFTSLAMSKVLGRNVQRLVGRPAPVRIWNDLVACKIPRGQEGASGVTSYHQDLPHWPFDRVGMLTVWIALDNVEPAQGAVRYVSGSHREGPLGYLDKDFDHLQRAPELLERHEMSPPLYFQPGDAAVHHGLTVHGAPDNETDRQRWSYLLLYVPTDVKFTGADNPDTRNLGLTPGDLFAHDRYPVVYP